MLTVRGWLAEWGWTGQTAELLLASSPALAGLTMDDPPPNGASRPGDLPSWVSRCGFCSRRVRVCSVNFELQGGALCPGRFA